MKNKKIIILAGVAAIAASAGVYGLTNVNKFSGTASGENEVGVFALNVSTNNAWTKDWERFDILSDRGTTATAQVCTWENASISKNDGALCHITAIDDDQARIEVLTKGITSISWEFNKDVNAKVEALSASTGFVLSEDTSTMTGTCFVPEYSEDVNHIFIHFYAANNDGNLDFDILSVTVTYSVQYCLSFDA